MKVIRGKDNDLVETGQFIQIKKEDKQEII